MANTSELRVQAGKQTVWTTGVTPTVLLRGLTGCKIKPDQEVNILSDLTLNLTGGDTPVITKSGEQVRYVGANIGYIPGVPMKDMDADEWNALDGELRESALRAGLYQLGEPEEGAEETADIKGEVGEPAPAEKQARRAKPKTAADDGAAVADVEGEAPKEE